MKNCYFIVLAYNLIQKVIKFISIEISNETWFWWKSFLFKSLNYLSLISYECIILKFDKLKFTAFLIYLKIKWQDKNKKLNKLNLNQIIFEAWALRILKRVEKICVQNKSISILSYIRKLLSSCLKDLQKVQHTWFVTVYV